MAYRVIFPSGGGGGGGAPAGETIAGPSDDIPALLLAASAGDVITLGVGVYAFTSTIDIPAGVTIRGVSRGGVSIEPTHDGHAFEPQGLGCGLERMTIDPPTSTTESAVFAGANTSIRAVDVDLSANGTGYGFRANEGTIEAIGCRALGETRCAFFCSSHPDSRVILRNCTVESGAQLLGAVQCSRGRMDIDGLLIKSGVTSAYGVRIQGTDSEVYGRNIAVEAAVTDGLYFGGTSEPGVTVSIDGFRCRSGTANDINLATTVSTFMGVYNADVRSSEVTISGSLTDGVDYTVETKGLAS